MFRPMYTAVTGLRAHSQWLEAISNNVANVNTVGFKTYKATFADALAQTLWSSNVPTASALGSIGAQIGLGAKLSSLVSDFTQGPLETTQSPTDLAVEGHGFFIVRDFVTGTLYYTRAGSFVTDVDNYLITADGLRVQGATTLPSATLQDIEIVSPDPADPMLSFTISPAGTITILTQSGVSMDIAQIALENFRCPWALEKKGNNLYLSTNAAGPQCSGSQYESPGTFGLGTIRPGFVEMSNVDLASEMSTMIIAQRGFQANARAITTSDEMLNEVVNLKR